MSPGPSLPGERGQASGERPTAESASGPDAAAWPDWLVATDLPDLTIDQYRAVMGVVRLWVQLKVKHEGRFDEAARRGVAQIDPDAWHSSLLHRMLYQRKPPLPEPPPLSYSYPDYAAVEGDADQARDEAPNVGRSPIDQDSLSASEHLALAAKAMTEEEREGLCAEIAKAVAPMGLPPDGIAREQATRALTALLGPAVQEEGR
jgi:hypothetical protein